MQRGGVEWLFFGVAYNPKRGAKVLRRTGWRRYIRSLALRIAVSAAATGCIPLAAAPAPRLYTVEHYDVALQSDLSRRQLAGEATLRFHSLSDEPVAALELDASGLEISSVEEGKIPQWFERKGEMLVIALANPLCCGKHSVTRPTRRVRSSNCRRARRYGRIPRWFMVSRPTCCPRLPTGRPTCTCADSGWRRALPGCRRQHWRTSSPPEKPRFTSASAA